MLKLWWYGSKVGVDSGCTTGVRDEARKGVGYVIRIKCRVKLMQFRHIQQSRAPNNHTNEGIKTAKE